MTRKNQKLINYNTSGTSANTPISAQTSNVAYGEIVVRYATEEPRLYIKKKDTNFAEFVDKNYTTEMINNSISGLTNSNAQLMEDVNELSGSVVTLSGTVASISGDLYTNYYDKEEIDGIVGEFKAFSGIVESNYATIDYVKGVSGNIETTINTLADRVTDNEGDISDLKAFSGIVESNYATIAYVKGVSGDIETTIAGLSGATTGLSQDINNLSASVVSISGEIYTETTGILDRLEETETNIGEINDDLSTLSGQVIALSAGTVALSGSIISYINNELSTVYTYKGSLTFAELPESAETGDVYNVTDSVGNIGDSDYTPAGTNYAWDGEKWDALGGTIDLSGYATTGSVDDLATRVTDNEGDISDLKAFSGIVESNYATIAYVKGVSGDIETTIAGLSGATTGLSQDINTLSASVVSISGEIYTETTGILDRLEETETNIGEINDDLSTLSGSVLELSGSVVDNYATKTEAAEYAANAYTNAVVYVDGIVEEINDSIDGIKDDISGITTSINTISTNVANNTQDIASLSAATMTIEATSNSAVQGVEFGAVEDTVVLDNYNSGAKAKMGETNHIVYLDLSNLVIDCGSF